MTTIKKHNPDYDVFIKTETYDRKQSFVSWWHDKKEQFEFSGELKDLHKFPKPVFKDDNEKRWNIINNIMMSRCSDDTAHLYDLGNITMIMEMYENIIDLISSCDDIYVSPLPSVIYNETGFETKDINFESLNSFKEYIKQNGRFGIYSFHIDSESSIIVRGALLNVK